jgi:hypothetical protein
MVNEMKEQIQNLQQDLEERGDAFEKLYEEHQQNVKVSITNIKKYCIPLYLFLRW